MKKGFSTKIAILVGFVLVGVMGLILWQQYISKNIQPEVSSPSLQVTPTPSKDDIATWETYRNEKYGFEVKYPLGWAVRDFSDNSVSIAIVNRGSQEDTLGYIQILAGTDSDSLNSLKAYGWIVEKEDLDFKAQNLQGVKFTAVSRQFGQTKYAYVFPFSDGKTLDIDYIINTGMSSKERSINQTFDLLAHSLRRL